MPGVSQSEPRPIRGNRARASPPVGWPHPKEGERAQFHDSRRRRDADNVGPPLSGTWPPSLLRPSRPDSENAGRFVVFGLPGLARGGKSSGSLFPPVGWVRARNSEVGQTPSSQS
jgi:hypothetical protein